MVRRIGRLAVAAVVLGVVVLVALTPIGRAEAHSGLYAASPGPGAPAGGEIGSIELFYGDLITAIDGSVSPHRTGRSSRASS